MSTPQRLDFGNYASYFAIKLVGNTTKDRQVTFDYQVKHPSAISFDLRKSFPPLIGTSFKAYLGDSIYFNLTDSRVQTMAKEIKETVGSNPSQATLLRAILKQVTEKVTYDYQALNSDSVMPATVSETLDKGTGVCQHFAALFTASRLLPKRDLRAINSSNLPLPIIVI